ncbi:4-hydroxybutyrate dehydrogenase [Halosquirtibacter xylanolyticus]|uniref:4-hydroxybutyrate dehydrogenase n=1 Tax=Halosquirtibacter xylanolyticus TaxID=3374599 RepID=UPI0037499A97|nr:4-hydroxybutyrate dehydrogenase [Prolixibacteraceae bacterium]
MQQLKLKTTIEEYVLFKDFADSYKLGPKDLILTNQSLYKAFLSPLEIPCIVIFREQFGRGEPNDEMINAIILEIEQYDFERVVAIGGGSIVDIAKLLVLEGVNDIVNVFEQKQSCNKNKELIVVPTTCGTGSEVTNISIVEIKSKHTKMGLANDAILPDHAILIPELLRGLPFKYFMTSAIDALIHATEALVSPKASPYTDLFSRAAIQSIVTIFQGIVSHGEDYRMDYLAEMLRASNQAGIAFGNAGVGAVHALSYPLGAAYHVPHGEANFQFFTPVLDLYHKYHPEGKIQELCLLLASILDVKPSEAIDSLDDLLKRLIPKPKLHEYGMKEEEIVCFVDNVILSQQRLLKNNYTALTRSDMEAIYRNLY